MEVGRLLGWSAIAIFPLIGAGLGVTDIFDEVNEDLRAERARRFAARYGVVGAVLLLLAVAGVAGWQFWHKGQVHEAEATATAFLGAMQATAAPKAGSPVADPAALVVFDRLAATKPSGYRTLARLRAASARAANADLPGALGLWDAVAADAEADPILKDLANLLWVQHQVDQGQPDIVETRLQTLLAPDGPYRSLALETRALLLIRTGADGAARDVLQGLVDDNSALEGVKARANGLLARLDEGASK